MTGRDRRKFVYITAGAGGMICGSCLRDNSLVKALQRNGSDIVLIPIYTPLKLDEDDVSLNKVFFGGINVFLQQKFPLFRHLPHWMISFLDHPLLLKKVASGYIETRAQFLGKLTLSMLKGIRGLQAREVDRFVEFLNFSIQPNLVNLSNLLISGIVPEIKSKLGISVVVTLQGDDVFLNRLKEPYRSQVVKEIKKIIPSLDGFIVFSRSYGKKMARMLDIPKSKIHYVPLGLNTENYSCKVPSLETRRSPCIGYLARVCPEKGLDVLVKSFIELKQRAGMEEVELHVAGWLGSEQRLFYKEILSELSSVGLKKNFHYHGVLDGQGKRDFLRNIDLFCVPTLDCEPKGLYVLEALASGVPVVEPDHDSFRELLGQSGGGVFFKSGDQLSLVDTLQDLLQDPERRQKLARQGHRRVHRDFTAMRMAEETLNVYHKIMGCA